jgi:hypothetical protein
MSDRSERDLRGLIAGEYLVDVTKRLPDASGGIHAFAATSRARENELLMALRVDRDAPARPRHLNALNARIEGLLCPVAHGLGPPISGEPAWYVICQAPAGPSVATDPRPWPESMLIEHVLRPMAFVLEQLQTRGLTHRAIRPNNVFHGKTNSPVVVGAAWAAPPAMHQPAVCETAYTALCHPAARGDGRIADDVYALGILLVTLALGRQPMEGLDNATVMYRKLELGDFAAVTGGERLPPILNDLVRNMLAEDPEHRPPPTLLRDPVGARGRRVAGRPASRAQKPFKVGAITVWNSRTLALAMAISPAEALGVIQSGTLAYWLRRALGDSGLAVKLEELFRQHLLDLSSAREKADAAFMMRAVMAADVFMPLCWRGLAMFPDGLGPALATAFATDHRTANDEQVEPDLHLKLEEILLNDAQVMWATMREERMPVALQRQEARQRRAILQIRGPAGGMPRLTYTLNPLIPCASKLLVGRWIGSVGELVLALDAIAAATPDVALLEPHIAAFIGARSERWLDDEVKRFANSSAGDTMDGAIATLQLLSGLQNRYHPTPLKGLASWAAARAQPLVKRWNNRERRTAVGEKLKALAALGFLQPILNLLEDPPGHAIDSEGLRMAIADLDRLDAELRDISEGGRRRSAVASWWGQEVAAGIGLAAIAITIILAVLN